MAHEHNTLLRRLTEEQVPFVIIGGVCGVLHGASLVTYDLDICCPFSLEALQRIQSALSGFNPRHRLAKDQPSLTLTPDLIRRLKNLYLATDIGVLDCLSEVAGIGDFDAVHAASIEQKFSFGVVRMLSIRGLIQSKEALGRDKDRAMIAQLRALEEEQK
ncbi:MAG TPA: nucleotidyltransferase [Methylomirabilota bacterium]|nr:nucleotidyltransferase [Methylomirabilota bacterium]